ncbi:hypothetical protein DFH28DRAFT_1119654 [Melampsora americana]|nr:hypothetical protein DFH28DRAFT_1119654 [Melampsora americana]
MSNLNSSHLAPANSTLQYPPLIPSATYPHHTYHFINVNHQQNGPHHHNPYQQSPSGYQAASSANWYPPPDFYPGYHHPSFTFGTGINPNSVNLNAMNLNAMNLNAMNSNAMNVMDVTAINPNTMAMNLNKDLLHHPLQQHLHPLNSRIPTFTTYLGPLLTTYPNAPTSNGSVPNKPMLSSTKANPTIQSILPVQTPGTVLNIPKGFDDIIVAIEEEERLANKRDNDWPPIGAPPIWLLCSPKSQNRTEGDCLDLPEMHPWL